MKGANLRSSTSLASTPKPELPFELSFDSLEVRTTLTTQSWQPKLSMEEFVKALDELTERLSVPFCAACGSVTGYGCSLMCGDERYPARDFYGLLPRRAPGGPL